MHLGNNDISEVETGAFNGLQGLKRLHLNNNKIDILRDDTFVGLESLEYLQIDYNFISTIEPNALSRLQQMTVADSQRQLVVLSAHKHFPECALDAPGS